MTLTRTTLFSRLGLLGVASVFAVGLAACNGGSTTLTPPPEQTRGFIRAVHGSPNAGAVDIYIYPSSNPLPSVPTFSNVRYPAITGYLSVATGSSTVAVYPRGTRTTASLTQTVQITNGEQETSAITGIFGGLLNNLGFTNFIEPVVTAGQTSVIVHHTAPSLVATANFNPVAVGIYDATMGQTSNTQAFSFSYTAGFSGPAASGQVAGGQFFLTPFPTTPAEVGFAAGVPTANGSPIATIATYATLQQLATNSATGFQNATLAGNAQNSFPAGGHLSVFAVDATAGNTTTPTVPTLIGTLDP